MQCPEDRKTDSANEESSTGALINDVLSLRGRSRYANDMQSVHRSHALARWGSGGSLRGRDSETHARGERMFQSLFSGTADIGRVRLYPSDVNRINKRPNALLCAFRNH